MGRISKLDALEILDSRGNPTLQVLVHLASGAAGVAKVPSGASTGKHEAVELRDGDRKRYGGKGVQKAVANVVGELQQAFRGFEGAQTALDAKLIALDGTPDKGRLGANTILGVSVGFAKACAAENGLPLYRHLFQRESYLLPVPMFNVLNGGRHADNNVDIQEFMIVPVGLPTFAEALQAASEVFYTLKEILKGKGYGTGVGDEGGFAPKLKSNEEAMELLCSAIQKAGYKPGYDIAINLDPAASEFYESGAYVFNKSDRSRRTSESLISLWENWLKRYPEIYSLEDGLAEDDWEGWRKMTDRLGNKVQLVGDDIFVTNTQIFQEGIRKGIANSILIKLNQIGTVTETLACMELASRNGYTAVVSHRSGETDDATIADLAVAAGTGQLKSGSVCRGERIAKYNRLLEIEKELGANGRYAGRKVYERWRPI
ncbi:MAG TPA: phosphopyruvate hydratase [Terriglobia bacterium]|nr:phosphopyruvate hydratase [Terriglobia bacterium]